MKTFKYGELDDFITYCIISKLLAERGVIQLLNITCTLKSPLFIGTNVSISLVTFLYYVRKGSLVGSEVIVAVVTNVVIL